jgi:putative ABC transport system ATP-binding protein
MNVCELHNIGKKYPLGELQVTALAGINLSVEQGEFTVFSGPSGSGKSTLLNLIGLLDTPSEGSLFIQNKDISGLSEHKLGQIRAKQIGFIFQSFNLIPVLSAFENVELALQLSSLSTKKERKEKVEEALLAVGLADLLHRRPSQLSGGQQQRVAIARALVKKPALVIADEPTANLDSENGQQILDIMQQLNEKNGATFLFSTHDPMVVNQAKRVVQLKDGKIISDTDISS